MTPADEATVEAVARALGRHYIYKTLTPDHDNPTPNGGYFAKCVCSCGQEWKPNTDGTGQNAHLAAVMVAAYESARGDVKPTRVQLAHRLFEADCYGLQPDDWERLHPGQWDSYFRMADAILALDPRKTEREVKAEALREAARDSAIISEFFGPEIGGERARFRAILPGDLLANATALEQGAGE